MFDKAACHAELEKLGLPVIKSISQLNWLEEILDAMKARDWKRVSSTSGM